MKKNWICCCIGFGFLIYYGAFPALTQEIPTPDFDNKTKHLVEEVTIRTVSREDISSRKCDNLLRYLNALIQKNKAYDLNHDGKLDKIDIFLLSSTWPVLTAFLPDLDYMQWTALDGIWSIDGRTIVGITDLDARLVSQEPYPTAIDWTLRITLTDGSGAGALFWADASGSTGYCVRLDRTWSALFLSRIGPWPEETLLDQYPWTILDGNSVLLRIELTEYGIRVYAPDLSVYAVLEAVNQTPMGNCLGVYLLDGQAIFSLGEINSIVSQPPIPAIPTAGEYQQIYDQSKGESEWWYINDHCFIADASGLWHLFGITHPYPPAPLEEDQFTHATSEILTASPWVKHPFALQSDPTQGEDLLWAPHVIEKEGLYYMFYAAGSQTGDYRYRMHLATSPDCNTWTRYSENPLFEDYYDARDPMVIFVDGRYVMYYTAVLYRPEGNHVVAYRFSDDLLHWSPRRIAFIHDSIGTYNGPTESPFVVPYNGSFYLFIGPDGDYRRTTVYRSSTPYFWDTSDKIAYIPSHAAEVIQDRDGAWYVSHAGWYYQGVYLAPLTWQPNPTVHYFVDLGDSMDYVIEQSKIFISDWRGTAGKDLVADQDAYFTLQFPVSADAKIIILEYEEEGETLLELVQSNGTIELQNDGNSGPGTAEVHRVTLSGNDIQNGKLALRFRDSDPSDGWGANVNWVRVLW